MARIESDLDERSSAEPLGAYLVEQGLLEAPGLERALRILDETGQRFAVVLTNLGLISEQDLAKALAGYLDLPLLEAKDYPEDPLLNGQLSSKFLKEFRVIPVADGPEGLALAMANPLDRHALKGVELSTGKTALPRVGVPAEIDAAFERLYGRGGSDIEEIVGGERAAEAHDDLRDIERLKDVASEAPVIRLVNHILSSAVERRASDVHIEPFETRMRVRYRVDGVLQEVSPPPHRLRQAVVSRVKIMAGLNIAETRLPQDGRIKLTIRGNEIDLRVSTVPTMHGESVVLRVLDRRAVELEFHNLGLEGAPLERFLGVLERPHGILLVTGPTGSGKTTTLYTSLKHLNTGSQKILTVEDPIEYQLDGINQVQVHHQIGLDFAQSLRSFLRQDPDIIMIGEIRDLETAQIAVQAALTGHLVLSTLHTNDAASSVTRLLDMGVEDYLLGSTVNGVVAQRLVRRLCPACREPYAPPPDLLARLGLEADRALRLYRRKGCESCNGTGFRGRTSIIEVLVMSEALSRALLSRADSTALQQQAKAEGMRTMYQDGMAKAIAGITSVEEVLRVTREA